MIFLKYLKLHFNLKFSWYYPNCIVKIWYFLC
jgi:hypothetical protein